MSDCIYCRIASHEIPKKMLYEDEKIMAFYDINPSAKIHVLILPKKHLVSIAEATDSDQMLLGKLILQAKSLAEKLLISQKGYKLVINTGKDGGQIIPHLHLHLLGGQLIKKLV